MTLRQDARVRSFPESLLDRISYASKGDFGLWLVQLVRDENPTVRVNAARNPNLPAPVMKEVANGSDEKAQIGLVQNTNLSHEAGVILRDSPDRTVQHILSQQHGLPLISAGFRPSEHSPYVLVELARLTDDPLLLVALANQDDPTVVAAANANPVVHEWLNKNHPELVGMPWDWVASALTA